MFCTHNETDLKPAIVQVNGSDWVTVVCKACAAQLGDRIRLVDMVDEAIKRARKGKEEPEPEEAELDPDFDS